MRGLAGEIFCKDCAWSEQLNKYMCVDCSILIDPNNLTLYEQPSNFKSRKEKDMSKKDEGRPSKMAKEIFHCSDCKNHGKNDICERCVTHVDLKEGERIEHRPSMFEAKYVNNEQLSSSCLGCAFYITDSGKSHCECNEICNCHDQFISRKGVEYEYVDHPSHYGGENNPYECIKVIEAWGLDKNFDLGTAIRYICRAGEKPDNPVLQDLKKARWYLDREIQKLEKLVIEKDI